MNNDNLLQPHFKDLMSKMYTKQTAALNNYLLFKHTRLCACPSCVNASSSKQTWTAAGSLQTLHFE